jgi:glycosyltransferase involved in cell wall biosynthesis
MKFNLSYIIATRNRLPFLKITLTNLINELQADEEIVVVDGKSTDGSKEYLEQLFEQGKIHQFVSEPDKNQAHAWNKAMLMARGVIIKKIIDDDVFCYEAIRACKNYMLLNSGIDVIISNDLGSSIDNYKHIQKHSRLAQFEKWRKGLIPSFNFGGVHMLIRRSSLAYVGLYNTAYIMMDWEYSLRISYLKANIAFYTGYNALSVSHPQTVSALKDNKFVDEQGKRACIFFEYAGDGAEIGLWSRTKIIIGKLLQRGKVISKVSNNTFVDINPMYYFYYDNISTLNKSQDYFFFTSYE